KTPIGKYTSSLLLGLQRDQQQSEGGQRFFRNEAVTLVGISYVSLSRPNIDVATIVVTNTTKTRTYLAATDYLIRQTGLKVEIVRVAAGSIGDGETVLVDYAAQVARDAEFVTEWIASAHRLQLKKLPLAFYADLRLRDETLRSGDDPGNLDQERRALLGAELDYKDLVVAVEREVRRQELSPSSVADRVRLDYHRALGRDIDLTAGGILERLRYSDGGRGRLAPDAQRLNTVGARVGLNAKLGANAVLGVNSSYLKLSGQDNSTLFRNTVSLQWQYGKLDFSVEANYDTYQQEETEGNSFGLMFYLRRTF
ncbi:MAG: hypothetical protein ACYS5V_05800, partial [Planctomycetota bacterium]